MLDRVRLRGHLGGFNCVDDVGVLLGVEHVRLPCVLHAHSEKRERPHARGREELLQRRDPGALRGHDREDHRVEHSTPSLRHVVHPRRLHRLGEACWGLQHGLEVPLCSHVRVAEAGVRGRRLHEVGRGQVGRWTRRASPGHHAWCSRRVARGAGRQAGAVRQLVEERLPALLLVGGGSGGRQRARGGGGGRGTEGRRGGKGRERA